MSIRINTNIDSIIAQNNLEKNCFNLSKTLERLSTGLRVNKSADDPSGMAVGTKLDTSIRGTRKALDNVHYGMDYLATAEGALCEITNMVQRIRELVIKAANDTHTLSDREKIQYEIDELLKNIDQTAITTEYNTIKPLQIDPFRLKELSTIPGECDISFIIDRSASAVVAMALAGIQMGLNNFVNDLKARNIDFRISVTAIAGNVSGGVGDATDGVHTILDSSNDVTMISAALAAIMSAGAEVDPYSALLQVAGLDDIMGMSVGGIGPGGDMVTRRNGVKYFQILVTDTICEDEIGTTGLFGVDPFGNKNTPMSINCDNVTPAAVMPTYSLMYGPLDREHQVADALASLPGTPNGATVFVLGDSGPMAGGIWDYTTWYDDIVSQTGGAFYDITQASMDQASFDMVLSAINNVIQQSLSSPGKLWVDPESQKIQTGCTEGDILSFGKPHITHDALGLVKIDVVHERNNTFYSLTESDIQALQDRGIRTAVINDLKTIKDVKYTDQSSFETALNGLPSNLTDDEKAIVKLYADSEDFDIYLQQVDTALERLAKIRADYGARYNRFESRMRRLGIYDENLSASKSRIIDTDFAKETANLTKNQILVQAGTAILAQANVEPTSALKLLQP